MRRRMRMMASRRSRSPTARTIRRFRFARPMTKKTSVPVAGGKGQRAMPPRVPPRDPRPVQTDPRPEPNLDRSVGSAKGNSAPTRWHMRWIVMLLLGVPIPLLILMYFMGW